VPNLARPSLATRARDRDRDAAIVTLREALVDGQISQDEFDARMAKVLEAKRLEDLEPLLADLQRPPSSAYAEVEAEHPHDPRLDPEPDGGDAGRERDDGRARLAAFDPRWGSWHAIAVAVALLAAFAIYSGIVYATGARPFGQPPAAGHVAYGTSLDDLGDNPVAFFGLYGPAESTWASLGAPSIVPYPVFADENGRSWLSADNRVAADATAYHWHIEFTMQCEQYSTVEARDVGDFYAATVDPRIFGSLVRTSSGDVEDMVWGGARGPADYALAMHAEPDDQPGRVRVALDLTGGTRPPLDTPDVPGSLSYTLSQHRFPVFQGMTYVASKVAAVPNQTWVCTTEQTWTAPESMLSLLRKRYAQPATFDGTDVGNPEGRLEDLPGGDGFVKNTTSSFSGDPEQIEVRRAVDGLTVTYRLQISSCTELDF
jgi:hypothetical protein